MFDIDMPEFEALQDALDGVANIDAIRCPTDRSIVTVYDDDPIRQIPCRKPPPRDHDPRRFSARSNAASP